MSDSRFPITQWLSSKENSIDDMVVQDRSRPRTVFRTSMRSAGLDLPFQLWDRIQRTLSHRPMAHVETPRDEALNDHTFARQKVGAVKAGISIRPGNRDTAHNSLDKVLWMLR